jgi:hypothetical protein
MKMKLEDATKILIQFLREQNHGGFARYGYQIYLPALITTYFRKAGVQNPESKVREVSPIFYNAAWELCRRGILRPGVKYHGAQATPDGSSGNGYSITPFGDTWLQEAKHDDFVPTEPERYGRIVGQYKSIYGPGFHERAQQAVRCYGAHAYLACCAMCGAAAESIILAAAVAKEGRQDIVLKKYKAAHGRRNVENILVGKARKPLQEDYRAYSSLLKYWRDEAAHGKSSNIDDNEAYTSLALLLRLAMFVKDNWAELTST